MQTIVELPEFLHKTQGLLKNEEKLSIINYLAVHPQSGDLMQGTGGIRKLRWAAQGRGKSGGVRVNLLLPQWFYTFVPVNHLWER